MASRTPQKFNDKLKSSGFNLVRASGKSNQTSLTNWDDMIACGMPKAKVSDAYKNVFGKTPDEVHLNDEFCKNYGWLSYNLLGDTTYYNVSIKPKSDISGERILENKTDEPYTQKVTLSTKVTNSATVSVTSASSVHVGSSISIGAPELGIGGEFTQDFTFENQVGSESTQSTEVTISDEVTVQVPPGFKYRVYLHVRWDVREEEWEMPIEIDPSGFTGAQFPSTVEGHYYWAMPHAEQFTPPFKSKIRGKVGCSYNTTGWITVENIPQ